MNQFNFIKKTKIIINAILLIMSVSIAALGYAADIGGAAQSAMEPLGIFSDFVMTACYIIGGLFLFASMVKYKEHRRSPLMVPISTVVFLVIAGIVLVLLPLSAYFLAGGHPYSLTK